MSIDTAVAIETPSGFRFIVRPATADDDAALSDFFAHVTKDDLRFRFLSSVKKVSEQQIARMTHVDHRQTEDYLVSETVDGPIIGNAMMAADKKLDTAEVAITVHEDFKGKGIEATLLEFVSKDAKSRGIKKLMSIENRENRFTIELESRMGFKARGVEGDPMLVVLETTL